MPATRTPHILRGNAHDPQVVDVTIWEPTTSRDVDGNVVVNEEGKTIVLKGWDIQPLVATTPAVFTPENFAFVVSSYRAYVPESHLAYWKAGRKVKNNSTNETFRMGPKQDWKAYGVIILEVSG